MFSSVMESLRFVRLHHDAQPPVRSTPNAAGFDLRIIEDVFLEAGGRVSVSTGLQLGIPAGTYGRIASRSGLAEDLGIHVGAGVVDRDFTGEVKILLFNFGTIPVQMKAGDRVAQLVLEKIAEVCAVEVRAIEETKRGSQGFGSTGLK